MQQVPLETAQNECYLITELSKSNGIQQNPKNAWDYARAKDLLAMIAKDATEYERGIIYICAYLGW